MVKWHGSTSREGGSSSTPGQAVPLTKTGILETTLPDPCHYGVSARTDWPGVTTLLLSETATLICNFYFSVAAKTLLSKQICPKYTLYLLYELNVKVTRKEIT